MSVGQMSVGQMSLGQMSLGQMSVGQMSVGQMFVGQMSVGQGLFYQKTFGPFTQTRTVSPIGLGDNLMSMKLVNFCLK